MNYEDFMKTVRARKNIRSYKADPVTDEVMNQVIEAGKWVPTGNNTHPIEIIAVKDKALIEQLEEIIAEAYAPKMSQRFGAQVILVVLGDPRFCDAYPKGFMREEILHSSLAAAIQNMLLASRAVGLGGSVWEIVPLPAAVKIKDLLGVPQLYVVKALLPLGYPKGEVTTSPKRDITLHENKYDRAKFKNEAEIGEMTEKYRL